MKPLDRARRALAFLASLELTLFSLSLLMALVVLCTLDQVHLGTFRAVERDMRALFIWWSPAGAGWSLPVFPGGGLVGAALLVNLMASFVVRFEPNMQKAGVWTIHAGLILLVFGEFVTGSFQVETQMPIEVGRTSSSTEAPRESELAVIDATDPAFDTVYSIPLTRVRRGGLIEHPSWPFALLVKRFFPNAEVEKRAAGDALPSLATAGIGGSLTVRDLPPSSSDDSPDSPAAIVEAAVWDRSLGAFLLSGTLGAPQGFSFQGRRWRLELRPIRHRLPFSLTLKEFRHDVYPGTDIPKNFASLVLLEDPAHRERRETLIYMNHPLRYGGKAFYQASFGKGDRLSVLQVVENPGWRLPYLSCALVALGLLVQFLPPLAAWARLGRTS